MKKPRTDRQRPGPRLRILRQSADREVRERQRTLARGVGALLKETAMKTRTLGGSTREPEKRGEGH